MGAITHGIPKPMLPVHGKPMLEHILERLGAAGVNRFFVVVGYHHQMIESHFRVWQPQSGRASDLEFRLQDPVNGTGSAARLANDFIGDNTFFLTYADILVDPSEYLRCAQVLQEQPATAAVLAVKSVDDPWQGAAVYEEQGRITRIIEKPPRGTSSTNWNSAGFYAFRPILFDYLDRIRPSPRNEYELTSALGSMLEDSIELRISAIQGEWRDVGRPEDLAAVNA